MKRTFILSLLALGLAAPLAMAQTATPTPPAAETQADQADQQMDGDGMMGWGRHKGDGGMGHRGKGRHGDHGGHLLRLIDANSDGVIGADEAAAMADGMFMRLDQNGDGTLDQAEFATPPQHRRGWFNWGSDEAAAVQKVRADKFTALDADKDGKLTKAEVFAEAQQKLAAADADKDGKVTPWEFRATMGN